MSHTQLTETELTERSLCTADLLQQLAGYLSAIWNTRRQARRRWLLCIREPVRCREIAHLSFCNAELEQRRANTLLCCCGATRSIIRCIVGVRSVDDNGGPARRRQRCKPAVE